MAGPVLFLFGSVVSAVISHYVSEGMDNMENPPPRPSTMLQIQASIISSLDVDRSLDDDKVDLVTVRLMRDTGWQQRFGIEATHYRYGDDSLDDVNAFGFAFQQLFGHGFNISLGAMGYVDYGDEDQTIFGLSSGIGWEANFQPFMPYIAYRNDAIFSHDDDMVQSLNVGVSIKF